MLRASPMMTDGLGELDRSEHNCSVEQLTFDGLGMKTEKGPGGVK